MVKASKDYITVISNNTVKFVNTIEGSAEMRLLPFFIPLQGAMQ